jgi:RNA polymerase sigma-70 factor (ECF subfamily)
LDGFRGGRWRFADAGELKAFLVRATRNRFLNYLRHLRGSLAHERPWDGAVPEPTDDHGERPSESARIEDLWQAILAECPPRHRELLRLKREGLSLAELATRSGLHESSIRRILYDLAWKFAAASAAGEIL